MGNKRWLQNAIECQAMRMVQEDLLVKHPDSVYSRGAEFERMEGLDMVMSWHVTSHWVNDKLTGRPNLSYGEQLVPLGAVLKRIIDQAP